jgi:hypothetical protein
MLQYALLSGLSSNVAVATRQLLSAIYSLASALNDTLPAEGLGREQLCKIISSYAPALRDSDKYSLLHTVVQFSDYNDDHYYMPDDGDTSDGDDDDEYDTVLFKAYRASVVSFISLLVQNECGWLDATNFEGNTALHTLAYYAVNPNSTLWPEDGVRDLVVECIRLLLASNAHADVRNNTGETPAAILARSNSGAVSSIMANYCPSLQCLAANVIHVHNLPLDDLPSHLKAFVRLH